MPIALKNRKLNLFVIVYTMAFIVLAIVGYNLSQTKVKSTYHQMLNHEYFATDLAMYDLPRISIDLTSGQGKTTRVRLDISLEVAKKDLTRLEGFKPRITDKIIMYMHREDFEGVTPPDVMRRLHSNLLSVVDNASKPVPVHDIVFRQFVIL